MDRPIILLVDKLRERVAAFLRRDMMVRNDQPMQSKLLCSELTLDLVTVRGVYTAGVLDFFMDAGIWLSHCYGVSAGAVNATNYLSRQRGRTFRITANYINNKRYCSVYNLLTTGDLFGADFLYNRISNELAPFDYNVFVKSDSGMTAVVTNVDTGKPEYKPLTDLRREMQWLRASCSLPLLAKIVKLDGGHYLDGGTSCIIASLNWWQSKSGWAMLL